MKTMNKPLPLHPATTPDTHGPYRLLLIALLALGALWRLFFISRDLDWVTNYWLFEDFGYSLKIAKNIALGVGETFDGMVPTNGYQPLYVWLMVPVFRVFSQDLVAPVYIAMVMLAAANVATGWFLHQLVKQASGSARWALVALAFWMFNLAVAKDGSNGLEAGLSTMLVAASIWYFASLYGKPPRAANALKLGLLLGLSFLGRVDAVFLAATVFAVILLAGSAPLMQRIRFVTSVAGGFLLVALPYATWNIVRFASPLPTSGQVTTGKSSLFDFGNLDPERLMSHVEFGVYIVSRMLGGVTSPGGVVMNAPAGRDLYIVLLAVLAFAASAWIGWRRSQGRARVIVLSFMLLAAAYGYGYTIHSFVPFERYYLPIVLAFAVVVPTALAQWRRSWAPALVGSLLVVLFIYQARPYITTDKLYTPGWHAGVEQLNKVSKPGDVVAASQSGNLGYFYRNGRAVNLDGVVNLDAYRARRAGVLGKYLVDNKVNYLADERGWVFGIADQVGEGEARARFYARMRQVHASPDYAFSIFELTDEHYASIVEPQPAGAWEARPHNELINRNALRSTTVGARLEFTVERCFDLKFMRHDWSGIVNVYRDGVLVREVDLYSPVQDPTYKQFFAEQGGRHVYAVEVADKKNPASHANEAWVDAILERADCGATPAR